jgi:hypothetical protein
MWPARPGSCDDLLVGPLAVNISPVKSGAIPRIHQSAEYEAALEVKGVYREECIIAPATGPRPGLDHCPSGASSAQNSETWKVLPPVFAECIGDLSLFEIKGCVEVGLARSERGGPRG